ncbi:MAG TPA: tripartite tricarboxylate transporter substrate-binding protein, partial [Ramlibacter sp.]|nr:tripartite tricarboxylate transporter substrate-binding protein [Ramlibacter sp.]
RNWYYFTWLSGDFNVEQHVHMLDVCIWAMGDKYPVKAIGTGGRIQRNAPEFGNIYDHFAVTYTFENGVPFVATCRQQSGCRNEISAIVHGTEGRAEFSTTGSQIVKPNGEVLRDQTKHKNHYQIEHDELFAAIRAGKPINNGEYMSNSTLLAINPHTFSKLPYDPDKSFKPVSGFLGSSLVMAVNAEKVAANNLQDFVGWARTVPGGVSYASFTAGNSSHFAGVILNQKANLNMVHVPFNGTPPAVQSLLAGNVQAAFLPLLAVKPHVDAGKVKVLAISTPKRSELLPNVPTFTEQGFPDMEIYIWAGLSAPANTPDAAISRLQAEFAKALNSPEIRQKWAAIDFQPLPMSPAEFRTFVQTDSRRWAEAVRISGFKATE